MTQPVGNTAFFADSADDDELELRNAVFWEAMLDHIRRDGFAQAPRRVLDIGCHRGGLLARIADLWGPAELIGI
ncbi:MAG TPA: class I SAM-dependent methyltransferase, partial [Polyangiales bacterium]|nr:class I SAM-dependent methyltransferase [Polyangiales bacterium]